MTKPTEQPTSVSVGQSQNPYAAQPQSQNQKPAANAVKVSWKRSYFAVLILIALGMVAGSVVLAVSRWENPPLDFEEKYGVALSHFLQYAGVLFPIAISSSFLLFALSAFVFPDRFGLQIDETGIFVSNGLSRHVYRWQEIDEVKLYEGVVGLTLIGRPRVLSLFTWGELHVQIGNHFELSSAELVDLLKTQQRLHSLHPVPPDRQLENERPSFLSYVLRMLVFAIIVAALAWSWFGSWRGSIYVKLHPILITAVCIRALWFTGTHFWPDQFDLLTKKRFGLRRD